MKISDKYYYQCCNCQKVYDASEIRYLCSECLKLNTHGSPPKGVLSIYYNYGEINVNVSINDLLLSVWPIVYESSLPRLRVGETPLYSYSSLNNQSIDFELFIKDDSQNPSYSFKDRASALVSAFAKEKSIETIVTASTGNAGSSLAAICASQSQKAVILLPKSAPAAKLVQVEMYGAQLIKVDGNYDQAFDESIKLSEEKGWFNRNTAFNPLTIEGKKSVSFEIFEQMQRQLPDFIFVPVGDGVILSGVYKGFEDLIKLGLISEMPIIVAVQAEGSSNIIDNIQNLPLIFKPASTIADSISVDIPRNYYMATGFLNKYNGQMVKVSDDQILESAFTMASNYGLFAEPASAAAFAGMIQYYNNDLINKDSKVLVLQTGSGLKDISTVQNWLNSHTF